MLNNCAPRYSKAATAPLARWMRAGLWDFNAHLFRTKAPAGSIEAPRLPTHLQRNEEDLGRNPAEWLPWNYHSQIAEP